MFTINAYHNPYLLVGQDHLQAVLNVRVSPGQNTTPAPLALAIALDRSGSMDGAKIRAARDGAIKIVQALDEHITFMLVAFNERAKIIMAPCTGTQKNKQLAINAIRHNLHATGGTCMSFALDTIVQHFGHDASRALKILFLTDGKNEGERRPDLDRAIEHCRLVQASINAWGIGTDWDEAELRHMAEATHGNADIIPTPQQVEAAFTSSFMEMRNTSVTSARLRLWSPNGVKISRFEQVYPTIVTLGLEPDAANPRLHSITLGSFATGDQRDYLLDLEVPTYPPGQQFLMVRPSITFFAGSSKEQEEKSIQEGWVYVQWTEDANQATQMEEHIAHYTHQEDLLRALKDGQAFLAAGQYDKATRLLGEALLISERTSNERITRLLSQIVQRDSKGTIQLNKQASEVARKTLAINSGRTSKLK